MTSTIGSYVMSLGLLFSGRDREERQRQARRERPLARRHARVVHDVTAAAAQLRLGAVRHQPAAALDLRRRLAERGLAASSSTAPGPILRTAAGAAPRRPPSSSSARPSPAARPTRSSRSWRCRCSPGSRSRAVGLPPAARRGHRCVPADARAIGSAVRRRDGRRALGHLAARGLRSRSAGGIARRGSRLVQGSPSPSAPGATT